jgi:hypothetical protein
MVVSFVTIKCRVAPRDSGHVLHGKANAGWRRRHPPTVAFSKTASSLYVTQTRKKDTMKTHVTRALAVAAVLIGLVPAGASAQQGTTITGHVTDEGNSPLVGVSVSIATRRVGAVTTADGSYSFTVPGATSGTVEINARRIGYTAKTVTVTLNGATVTQNFTLSRTAMELEGIVVTALGIEKSKKALGVAQQTLDSSSLTQNAATTNMISTLSGKIAGISVTSATTQGGSAPARAPESPAPTVPGNPPC